jgi:hypothetical protein
MGAIIGAELFNVLDAIAAVFLKLTTALKYDGFTSYSASV